LYATGSNLALAAWEAGDVVRLVFLLELMEARQDDRIASAGQDGTVVVWDASPLAPPPDEPPGPAAPGTR
jgi:hypothetical protein